MKIFMKELISASLLLEIGLCMMTQWAFGDFKWPLTFEREINIEYWGRGEVEVVGRGGLVNPPQDLYDYVPSNRVMIMGLLIMKGVSLFEAFLERGVILQVHRNFKKYQLLL